MRKSMAAGRASGADEESAAQKFSDPALKEMYSTVIKLSTENKINAKNTWSFDFIERMDDMIAADDSGMGGMTNFQKASCTLDASVKLYSYRVDDVWSSSFRVLENLSRRPEGGPSDSDAGSAATKQRRRAGGSGSTLESNPAAITLSEGGEGAAMDPLFHKMSKTFDAGGAGGLLLHNLPVQRGAALDLTGGAPLPALATDPALATAAVDPAGAEAAGSAVLLDAGGLR
ncbi:CAPH, partial [Symbiodinium sp. KB8]